MLSPSDSDSDSAPAPRPSKRVKAVKKVTTPRKVVQDSQRTNSPATTLPTVSDQSERLPDEVHRLERLVRSQSELISSLQRRAEEGPEALPRIQEIRSEVSPDHHLAFSRYLGVEGVAEVTTPMELNEYMVWLGKKYTMAKWKEKARDLTAMFEVPRREIVAILWNSFAGKVRA